MRNYHLIIDALIAAASILLRSFTVDLLSATPNNVGTLALSELECLTMSRFTPSSGKNHLYYGDNLEVLRKYVPDESVDLCYIDPPFNSKRNYNQIYTNVGKEDAAQAQAFVDTWNWDELAIKGFQEIAENRHGIFTAQTINLILGLERVLEQGSLLAYLVSMTLRIAEIHRVLKPTGSFYFHCDPTSSHYLKLVIDSIFCPCGGDFSNEIIWHRTSAKSLATRRLPSNHDVIFCYHKSANRTWNQDHLFIGYEQDNLPEKTLKKYCHKDLDGRIYRFSDLTNPNPNRPNLTYEFLGVTRVWRWTKERMQKAYEDGLIVQTKPGTVPQLKRYIDEQRGIPIDDTWIDIAPLNSQAKERLGYPTQKPESLLERIVKASSNEGDVILDAYCGCGTTVAVAQNLSRKWIGIDITYQAVSLILKRLEDTHGSSVLTNVTTSGLPKDLKSAEALATRKDDRTRKEFEKWAVLTYSKNRAAINQKKGADKGIDGQGYFPIDDRNHGEVIFQVKSGNVGSKDIRDLVGTMTREKAELGIFITLKPPTKAMIQEAKACGLYHWPFGREIPRIQIVTVASILDGSARLDVPLAADVLRSANRRKSDDGDQMELLSA
jgi:DNA modification methylase